MTESLILLQETFVFNNHHFEIKINDSLTIDITKDNVNITDIQILFSEFTKIKTMLFTMINNYSQYNSDYNQTSIQGILTNKNIIHPSKLALNSNIDENMFTINDIETIYKLVQFEKENSCKNKIIASHPKYNMIMSMMSIMNPFNNEENRNTKRFSFWRVSI